MCHRGAKIHPPRCLACIKTVISGLGRCCRPCFAFLRYAIRLHALTILQNNGDRLNSIHANILCVDEIIIINDFSLYLHLAVYQIKVV